MIWWTQILIALISAASFGLLLTSNRRQDAQQNAFLLGLLCGIESLMVPESILLFPFVLWLLAMLKALNARTVVATLLGLLVLVFYGAIVWLIWPNGGLVHAVENVWLQAFNRQLCWQALPLWALITMGVAALIGFAYQIAHISRYAGANVRIQTRFLLTLPTFWISLLSCFFPAADGNCLLGTLILPSLYLMVLFTATYGLPHLSNPFSHPFNPYMRSFGKHSRGSNPFTAPRAPKPTVRSFSRHSRRR